MQPIDNAPICHAVSLNLRHCADIIWRQTVSPASTTTYQVTITNLAGCMDTDSIFVEVLPFPLINAGNDTTYCEGNLAQLNAEANDDYTYSWSPAIQLTNPVIANPIILTTTSTTYTLTITDLNGCTNTDEVLVDFDQAPDLMVSDDMATCEGQVVQLDASGAEIYAWSPSDNLDCDDCPTVFASPDETTVYTVIGTSLMGCTSIETIEITVGASINTEEMDMTCEGVPVAIFEQLTDVPGIYCDTIVTSEGCDSIHCITLEVEPRVETTDLFALCPGDTLFIDNEMYTEAGEFCTTFTASNGCDSLHCLNISLAETFTFTIPDTIILLGETVSLSLPDIYTYSWMPPIGISCTDCSDPIFSPEETTTYSAIVTNESGCESSIQFTITVVTDCKGKNLELPNAITPDGDGVNDTFGVANPFGLERVISMEIYDRWGEKVFEASGRAARWDAMLDNKPLPSDVYIYILKIECVTGEEEFLYGDITVIR